MVLQTGVAKVSVLKRRCQAEDCWVYRRRGVGKRGDVLAPGTLDNLGR